MKCSINVRIFVPYHVNKIQKTKKEYFFKLLNYKTS